VEQWQQKVSVSQACRVLNVSRSGYYAAKVNTKSTEICSDSVHLKAAFAESQQTFGSRRLLTEMHKKGIRIGRYKIRRLMREAHLVPVWKRKFISTTDSKHALPVAENVLNRRFNPEQPNQAWTADVTYIRTRTGWLYLAVVLELFSRKVIGWAMSATMPADLVCRALKMAIGARKPAAGLIMHSDRGSQYASHEYQALLKQYGMVCSMSRKGNCWDNAVMERFFLNLKMERVWRRDYANHWEAEKDVSEYIVGFYNCVRLHSARGNLPPVVYEQEMAAKKPILVSGNT
jgi:transposase InsO family protein